jgi:hypothetical protein
MQTSDNDADAETESVFFAADDDADDEGGEDEFYHHQHNQNRERAQKNHHLFRDNDEFEKNFFKNKTTTNATNTNTNTNTMTMMITERALKPRTGRMKTRAAAAAGAAGAGGGGRKTSGRKKNTVASRSHARLGVSPVRGRRKGDFCATTTTTTTSAAENNSTNNNAAMMLSLSRKKEKKKRTIQQRRERTSKHRYSLGAAFSDGGGGTDDDSIVDRDARNGNAGRVVTGNATTAMEREDAKRRQLLYKRLDRLKQLPSQSQFAKTQIALVNKCLEMLMKVTVRTNEEEDELAKLLSSVKI